MPLAGDRRSSARQQQPPDAVPRPAQPAPPTGRLLLLATERAARPVASTWTCWRQPRTRATATCTVLGDCVALWISNPSSWAPPVQMRLRAAWSARLAPPCGDHRGTAGPDVIDIAAGQRADRPVNSVASAASTAGSGVPSAVTSPATSRAAWGLGDDKGERLATQAPGRPQDGLRAECADVVAGMSAGGEDGQHARPGSAGAASAQVGVRVRCRHRLGVQAAVGQRQVGGEPGPAGRVK